LQPVPVQAKYHQRGATLLKKGAEYFPLDIFPWTYPPDISLGPIVTLRAERMFHDGNVAL